MRLRHLVLMPTCLLLAVIPGNASTRTKRGPTSSKKVVHPAKPKIIGQRGIEDSRATELQTALIKSGYLTGTPSGHWDAESEAAMTRLQADNGWQTKLVPDSRAIIKLGLGPSTADSASKGLGPLSQP